MEIGRWGRSSLNCAEIRRRTVLSNSQVRRGLIERAERAPVGGNPGNARDTTLVADGGRHKANAMGGPLPERLNA